MNLLDKDYGLKLTQIKQGQCEEYRESSRDHMKINVMHERQNLKTSPGIVEFSFKTETINALCEFRWRFEHMLGYFY